MANQKYVYERLTPEQFRAAQAETGIGGYTLARLLGFPINRIEKWERGEDEVPHIVAVTMALLTLPGAQDLAFAVTDHAIVGRTDRKEAGHG